VKECTTLQLGSTSPSVNFDSLAVRLTGLLGAIAKLVCEYLSRRPTPTAMHEFELKLQALLREMGRVVMEWTLNEIEPTSPDAAPRRVVFEGQEFRRKPKSNRPKLGTLFGPVKVERFLYEPLECGEPSVFPLEINLGVVARRATPALAERVALHSSQESQQAVLSILKRDHGIEWSVPTLRKVVGEVSAGMAPQLHDAQLNQVLAWLEKAKRSRGKHPITLAAGRDGIFIPIRKEEGYKEAAVATLSVHDRRGRRLGTVYLGRMPEPYQNTLSDSLTRLLSDVLRHVEGSLPRLAYITDAGHHPTWYFTQVLKHLSDPRDLGRRLNWIWIVDFYHASQYVAQMAESLFGDTARGKAWTRKMCRWLKHKPRGIFRLLHSAAYHHARRRLSQHAEENYQGAHRYLLDHQASMDYVSYKAEGLPIGSGVTEAACKTVFTQRFKQSGMSWEVESGQTILDLRLARLSHVWAPVYAAHLHSRVTIPMATKRDPGTIRLQKAA
jgi:hypothetical protein